MESATATNGKCMEPMTPYLILQGNTDGSLVKDDVIWMSRNGDINNAGVGGFLSKEDLTDSILDFIAEELVGYTVKEAATSEILVRKEACG